MFLSNPKTKVLSKRASVDTSEVTMIADVPTAITDILKVMGDVTGKIIIDAMNSVMIKPVGFNNTFQASEDLAIGAEIIKWFNSTGFENMINPV